MRGRIEVESFYADAPWPQRRDNPDNWTSNQTCDEIEGTGTELRCSIGPGGNTMVHTDELRFIKPDSGYSEDLLVEFMDGRTEDCVKITGSTRDLTCKRHWDDDRDSVDFAVHEVEGISTVEHNRSRF